MNGHTKETANGIQAVQDAEVTFAQMKSKNRYSPKSMSIYIMDLGKALGRTY